MGSRCGPGALYDVGDRRRVVGYVPVEKLAATTQSLCRIGAEVAGPVHDPRHARHHQDSNHVDAGSLQVPPIVTIRFGWGGLDG